MDRDVANFEERRFDSCDDAGMSRLVARRDLNTAGRVAQRVRQPAFVSASKDQRARRAPFDIIASGPPLVPVVDRAATPWKMGSSWSPTRIVKRVIAGGRRLDNALAPRRQGVAQFGKGECGRRRQPVAAEDCECRRLRGDGSVTIRQTASVCFRQLIGGAARFAAMGLVLVPVRYDTNARRGRT